MTRACWPLVSLVLIVGCNQSEFDPDDSPDHNPDGPGTPQWGEVDVSCSADKDCNYGEACTNGVCQMKRCGKEYPDTAAPLGVRKTLLADREIVVSDGTASGGKYYARGFKPGASSFTYSTADAWSASTTRISDIAGGALLEDGAEIAIVSRDNSTFLYAPKIDKWIDTGFIPVAVTAGDVDMDGMDEAIALGSTGKIAICNVDTAKCDHYSMQAGTVGRDIAAGDVDGDGVDELVFHIELNGTDLVMVWNTDSVHTGQPAAYQITTDEMMAVTVSDTDGNGRAEIYGLVDGGWWGWASDKIYAFTSNGAALAAGAQTSVSSETLDLAGADIDHDKQGELITLTSDNVAHVFRGSSLTLAYQNTLTTVGTGQRIAAVDFDGDSAVGRLEQGPELVSGEVVPTTVLYMPPYYETLSGGKASVNLGNGTQSGSTSDDSIGLSVGLTLGFGGEIPGILEGEVAVNLEKATTYTHSVDESVIVTQRFSVEADPKLYGVDSAAVALSCGCYHSYTYELSSPAAGGNGQKVVVLVPVGGETLLWSSKRYNAMAKAVGNLPIIEVPMTVGDARSYPTTPQRADGSAIPAADLVFQSKPATRVSDVGDTEWSLWRSNTETNGMATSVGVSVEASVTVAGFKLGGSAGLSVDQGYSVTVGSTFELGGVVPPVPDNPSTPEDEYAVYAYGFQPVVYRQHYKTKDGADAAYYVVNYAVDF